MLKKLLLSCVAVMAIMALNSCGSKKIVGMNYSDLNGEWDVIEMNGKSLNPAQTNQFLVFDTAQNTISGNAGCNRLSGRLEQPTGQKHILRIMQVASTRMACLDDSTMQLENDLLKNIEKVARFEAIDEAPSNRVALYGMDNTLLFVLRKK